MIAGMGQAVIGDVVIERCETHVCDPHVCIVNISGRLGSKIASDSYSVSLAGIDSSGQAEAINAAVHTAKMRLLVSLTGAGVDGISPETVSATAKAFKAAGEHLLAQLEGIGNYAALNDCYTRILNGPVPFTALDPLNEWIKIKKGVDAYAKRGHTLSNLPRADAGYADLVAFLARARAHLKQMAGGKNA
jgi:hypothetical protein